MLNFLSSFKNVPVAIWCILGLLLTVFIVFFISTLTKNSTSSHPTNQKLYTKKLVLGSLCIAISFILSFFKIMSMPQGGSVTLASMFPLIIYAFICGPSAGITAGVAYGFLQFLQDAYAAHWISILLDYPVAFACLGLAGFVPSHIKSLEIKFALGAFLAVLGRLTMHVLSGAIFFAEYAPEGMNPWLYSIGYNGSFLVIEFSITLILGLILIKTPIYSTLKTTFNY